MKYRVRLKPWNIFLSTYVHLPGDLKVRLVTQVSSFNLRQPASPFGQGLRPQLYGLGIRDNPPPRQLYWAFICENVLPVGRLKLDSAWLLIKCSNIPLSLIFFDYSGFCRVDFHLFDTNLRFKSYM